MSEKEQLLSEMREMGKHLRAAGIDFLIVLNKGTRDYHQFSVNVNVPDDHHMLDMLGAVVDTWCKANH